MHIVTPTPCPDLDPTLPTLCPVELAERAELLAVGVEIAEMYISDGEAVPDALLSEMAEYRAIRARLARRRPAPSTRVRLARVERREASRALRLVVAGVAA